MARLVWFLNFSRPGPAELRILSAHWFRAWWYGLLLHLQFAHWAVQTALSKVAFQEDCAFPPHPTKCIIFFGHRGPIMLYQYGGSSMETRVNWYHIFNLFQDVLEFLINLHPMKPSNWLTI